MTNLGRGPIYSLGRRELIVDTYQKYSENGGTHTRAAQQRVRAGRLGHARRVQRPHERSRSVRVSPIGRQRKVPALRIYP